MTTEQQTTDLRTRALRAAFDIADPAAIVTTGAVAGLATYRALAARPAETRLTLALAAAGLAVAIADQSVHRLITPARRHLGIERHPAPVAPVPSPEQLAADALAHTAAQAANSAYSLDHSGGALTKASNWIGDIDGTATCQLTPAAHLLYQPSGTDSGLAEYTGRPRYYELVADGEYPVVVTTITQLADLLERHAAGRPLDASDDDPWTTIPDHGVAVAAGADDGDDSALEDDVDQEAEAWADGRL